MTIDLFSQFIAAIGGCALTADVPFLSKMRVWITSSRSRWVDRLPGTTWSTPAGDATRRRPIERLSRQACHSGSSPLHQRCAFDRNKSIFPNGYGIPVPYPWGCNLTKEYSSDEGAANVQLIPSLLFIWARSLTGRASGLHPEDRRFNSCRVHLLVELWKWNTRLLQNQVRKHGSSNLLSTTVATTFAALVQLEERSFRKGKVSGSSPESGSLRLRSSIGRASAF